MVITHTRGTGMGYPCRTLTMPKHKFENLKNLGSWSNYRGLLPDDKENVSSNIMIPFFTKKQNTYMHVVSTWQSYSAHPFCGSKEKVAQAFQSY